MTGDGYVPGEVAARADAQRARIVSAACRWAGTVAGGLPGSRPEGLLTDAERRLLEAVDRYLDDADLDDAG